MNRYILYKLSIYLLCLFVISCATSGEIHQLGPKSYPVKAFPEEPSSFRHQRQNIENDPQNIADPRNKSDNFEPHNHVTFDEYSKLRDREEDFSRKAAEDAVRRQKERSAKEADLRIAEALKALK